METQSVDFAITALVWTFRALAGCAGMFIMFDWLAIDRRNATDIPPYDRLLNQRAWALAAVGCTLGGLSYILFDVYFISPRSGLLPNLGVLGMWAAWASALVLRCAARAEQPRLIWAASTLIAVGAFLVLVLGGRPGL